MTTWQWITLGTLVLFLFVHWIDKLLEKRKSVEKPNWDDVDPDVYIGTETELQYGGYKIWTGEVSSDIADERNWKEV